LKVQAQGVRKCGGYTSRFGEVDLEGEVMQPQAFRDIKNE
jgi:hypothetical protein